MAAVVRASIKLDAEAFERYIMEEGDNGLFNNGGICDLMERWHR